MVICHVKLTCGVCESWRWVSNSSGNKDGYVGPFDCPHFHSSIYCCSTMGWFFGTNAMARIEVDYYCKECGRRESGSREYSGYGTSYSTYDFKCCGNTLHFKWNKS